MPTKIMIGIPSGGMVHAKTARTLVSLAQLFPTALFHFRHGNFSFENREKLADSAVENKCTHLFLVDADMDFPADVLTSLLELNKDIVGTHYNFRFLPLESTVRDIEGNPLLQVPSVPFQCSSVGSGCVLIKTNVFKAIEKPFYTWERDAEGTISATEDVLLCEKARGKGFEVWCAPLPVKHLGEYAF